MEEPAPTGCGGLLQLARRGDRNPTRRSHRNSRVAVGARGAKTERHPFDASGDGMRVNRPHLGGVVHPYEDPAETTSSPARIPLAVKVAEFVIEKLDVTSLPSTLRPK